MNEIKIKLYIILVIITGLIGSFFFSFYIQLDQSKASFENNINVWSNSIVDNLSQENIENIEPIIKSILRPEIDSIRVFSKSRLIYFYPKALSKESCQFVSEITIEKYGVNFGKVQACFESSHLITQTIRSQIFLSFIVIIVFFALIAIIAKQKRDAKYLEVQLKHDISRQLAHDIRSPLNALNALVSSDKLPTSETNTIKSIIDRVNTLAKNLLNEDDSTSNNEKFLLESYLAKFVEQKRLEYNDRNIVNLIFNADPSIKDSYIVIDKSKLSRALSNLINNSYEAIESNGEVILTATNDPNRNNVSLVIQDTGRGISGKMVNKILEKGKTTKKGGHGLGLTFAKAFIEESNGELIIESVEGRGTTITIILPSHTTTSHCVLIEDDLLVTMPWKESAKQAGVNLSCFNNVQNFLEQSGSFEKESIIYIDSDLGDGLKGEQEAEKIYQKGFREIYLQTSFEKSSINKPKWVKDIIDKKPPWGL